MIYGFAYSPEVLDSTPLPVVPRHLLPWLIKDRKEAEVGTTYYNSETKQHDHDRSGLDYAERELRRIAADLRTPGNSADRNAILSHQLDGQQQRVDFWRGKIALLDRVIAATQASP